MLFRIIFFFLTLNFSQACLAQDFADFLSEKLVEKLEREDIKIHPEKQGLIKAHINLDRSLRNINENDFQELNIDSFDLRSGKFKASVTLSNQSIYKIQGRFEEFVEIPVLRSRIMKGEVVKASDIYKTQISGAKYRSDYLTENDEIVGKTAKRSLMAHTPISSSLLQTENLITNNQTVTVIYEQGGLELKLTAKALQDGVAGDMVQVKNLRSGAIISGVVTGKNTVRVEN
jgi:flagella basal body P-ring formation protein FlgA